MTTLNLGSLIATRRRALRLTQAELASRVGVGRRTLIELESGSSANDIGFRKLERILNALGLVLAITENSPRPTEAELRDIFADEDE